MEDRRKLLGRRIKRDRMRAGFPSQRAFAQAIGVDTSGVAYAESGSGRVGVRGKIFSAIEDCLGWPEDSIALYLETGDESLLRGQVDKPKLTPDEAREVALARLTALEELHPEVHDMIQRAIKAVPDDKIEDILTEQ
jgi:hypothetical protein